MSKKRKHKRTAADEAAGEMFVDAVKRALVKQEDITFSVGTTDGKVAAISVIGTPRAKGDPETIRVTALDGRKWVFVARDFSTGDQFMGAVMAAVDDACRVPFQ